MSVPIGFDWDETVGGVVTVYNTANRLAMLTCRPLSSWDSLGLVGLRMVVSLEPNNGMSYLY